MSIEQNLKMDPSVGRALRHPAHEDRIETLRSYDILDTPREKDFDDIVALASAICETPISLISLVDEDRQWFKARRGLDDTQTPLDCAICAHAILGDSFTEIPDTLNDPRTATNPLVTGDRNLRFYAGAPLIAPNGLPIGTLCVLSDEPRDLTPLQKQALQTLADQVMTQLEMRRLLRNQEVLRNEIDHRVKNSLQTVRALISLYAAKMEDASAKDAFAAIERRLDSIITLHAELHDSKAIERVGLKNFLERVVALLSQTLPPNVTIKETFANIHLTSSEATSVAVIVSEFVANAIKHAFPDGRAGKIRISAQRNAQDDVVLRCEDDGVGGEVADDDAGMHSLGMRIMNAAGAQIGGAFTVDSSPPGYRCQLVFTPATGSPSQALMQV